MFLPHTSVWRYRFRHPPQNPFFIFKNPRSENFFILRIQKGAPKGALIGVLDITYLILSCRIRHYLYIELFRITFLQCEAIDCILLHVQSELVHQS